MKDFYGKGSNHRFRNRRIALVSDRRGFRLGAFMRTLGGGRSRGRPPVASRLYGSRAM
jgi:hypothetical protein